MSAKDDRFFVLNVNKGGVSKARNEGLKFATGVYVQFVDADDTLKFNMLEKMVKLIESNKAELAICSFEHPFFKTYLQSGVYDLSNVSDIFKLYQDPFGLVVPWNKLWRREIITEKFDEEVAFSEDELFNISNLFNVKKVAVTDECLYNYFIAPPEEFVFQNSCICRIIRMVENDENAGFYWLGTKLLDKRKAIIQNGIMKSDFPVKKTDEIAYHVLINFAIHTLSAYIGMKISKSSLVKNYLAILDSPPFLQGFKAQEKSGFKLKSISKTYKLILMNKFIDVCMKIYEEKKGDGLFKISNAYMSAFLDLFAEVNDVLDFSNQNARLILDMQAQSTKEAIFTREVLENDFISDNNFGFTSNHCVI